MLNLEQKFHVDNLMRQGCTARQACVKLGLTKEYVDNYVNSTPLTSLEVEAVEAENGRL